MRRVLGFVCALPFLACGSSGDGEEATGASQDELSKSAKKRIEILEDMLPELGRNAARLFAEPTGTATLGVFRSANCVGPKTAFPDNPWVNLGTCSFVMRNDAGTTTFTAEVKG